MSSNLQGGQQLSNRLHAIANGGPVILRRLQIGTVYEAKKLVARKTGTTGRTIRPGRTGPREAFVVAGGAALFLEKGTRPHVIVPRNGQALRFPAKGTPVTLAGRVRSSHAGRPGAYVFATKVNHPGTKPQPFLLPGAKRAVAKAGLDRVVVDLWNKAA